MNLLNVFSPVENTGTQSSVLVWSVHKQTFFYYYYYYFNSAVKLSRKPLSSEYSKNLYGEWCRNIFCFGDGFPLQVWILEEGCACARCQFAVRGSPGCREQTWVLPLHCWGKKATFWGNSLHFPGNAGPLQWGISSLPGECVCWDLWGGAGGRFCGCDNEENRDLYSLDFYFFSPQKSLLLLQLIRKELDWK